MIWVILMYHVVNFRPPQKNMLLANLAAVFIKESIFGVLFLSECSGYSGDSVMLCDEWKRIKIVQCPM